MVPAPGPVPFLVCRAIHLINKHASIVGQDISLAVHLKASTRKSVALLAQDSRSAATNADTKQHAAAFGGAGSRSRLAPAKRAGASARASATAPLPAAACDAAWQLHLHHALEQLTFIDKLVML